MQINYHFKDIVITDHQKEIIDKKLKKLKRFIKDEPLIIDLYADDVAGGLNKNGGVDKSVRFGAEFSGEKIFVEQKDSEVMRAFASVYKRAEIQMSRIHEKRIDASQTGE